MKTQKSMQLPLNFQDELILWQKSAKSPCKSVKTHLNQVFLQQIQKGTHIYRSGTSKPCCTIVVVFHIHIATVRMFPGELVSSICATAP